MNGSIDRETVAAYPLRLTVTDHGNPSRAVNISLTIAILDENDHCPQLHLDSSFLMINRDLTSSPFLTHLLATDNDQDTNARITFELSPSTSPSFVTLDSNGTLIIDTESKLIEENSVVVLHVQVRDHGQPTPCLIVETLRVFIGSNRTDWITVAKNNHRDETTLVRPEDEPTDPSKPLI